LVADTEQRAPGDGGSFLECFDEIDSDMTAHIDRIVLVDNFCPGDFPTSTPADPL